mgnify:FL=1
MSFLEELSNKGIISENQIGEIKNRANEKYGGDVDEALVEFGVPAEQVLSAKGEYLMIPVKKVDIKNITEVLKYIPEDSANYYQFVPIQFIDGVLEVGIVDPENIQAMDALQFISVKLGIPFKVFLISKKDYQDIMNAYKGLSTQVEEALSELGEDGVVDSDLTKELQNVKPNEEAKIVEDAPIIKIVAVILRNALEGNASDIHIEHTGENVKVRFRVDGALTTSIVLPKNTHSGVVARIKILAKLRKKK